MNTAIQYAPLTPDSSSGWWEGKYIRDSSYSKQLHSLLFQWVKWSTAAAAAKSLQLCLTLCDPIDGSPRGSPVPGILQARTLEWVAISFSNAWKWKGKVKSLSRVRLLATHGLHPTRLFHPWDFPGKSTGVGCHCLLRWSTADNSKCLVCFWPWQPKKT